MNRLIQTTWRKLCVSDLLILMPCLWVSFAVNAGQFEGEPQLATNVFMLRGEITHESGRICTYDLEGTILAADYRSGILFFQDNSGTTVLELNLGGAKRLSGQRIRLRGTNYVACTDVGLSLGTRPLVDDDDLHPATERSGEVYVKAGWHPIRVNWFNRTGSFSLQVDYSGQKIARQAIPAAALFRSATALGDASLLPGLFYRCFEGEWEKLPDFNTLVPQKTGIVSNFDIAVKLREENIGLEFKGLLKIPDDGNYRFYLSSDDGSQLFLNDAPPDISIIGTVPVPAPQPIAISQPLLDGPNCLWAEVEGTITFMSWYQGHVKFELASGEKQMQVEVLNAPAELPWYLLNSRVRLRGICPNLKNAAGQKYAGTIVAATWRDVSVLDVAPGQWSAFRSTTIGQLQKGTSPGSGGIANLRGHLNSDPVTQSLRLEDPTGSAHVELLTGIPDETSSVIDCLGRWNLDRTNILLYEAVARQSMNELNVKTNAARVLTTAMQVQQLTREEADREYPIEIKGVVTWVSDDLRALLIQDFTRAVFVWLAEAPPQKFPSAGDYCKVEGVSRSADFSPIVVLHKATVLWRGQMPQPVSPTRDQLLSGSLDAQYIEVRGLVIATHDTYITLLSSDGTLDLNVSPAPPGQWGAYLNSIIRIRGCVRANWDTYTHHVVLDEPIHLLGATVSIDSPPPTDLFEADKVRAKDLMQFDVHFDTFRRVKVRGQIIHCDANVDYLMDNMTGLRFRLVPPMQFKTGDEVEVVGLVELGGASPILRQAVARVIGHMPLLEPRQLSLNSLSNSYDSTLVTVEGTLVAMQNHGAELVLELQVGVKSFVARLNSDHSLSRFLTIGSRLKLTGTFCALDGDRLVSHEVNSFELLLNSPADVQVLALPPWWTLRRLLLLVASLLVGLTLAFVWITMLRRQVERRTQQLGREISERERAEKLRAIEHERSRIARDLHDDLGSTLTEISMMATVRPGMNIGADMAAGRLQEIAEKSRSMVFALDGVVWVVNSKNDTLSALIEYLASHTEEFLAKAQVGCRVELPKNYLERIISSEIRHDVMLAVREALNNSVRHGRPKEVLLRMIITGDSLEILVQDDGAGFDPIQVKGNGLGNLQHRMDKLNGSCHVESFSGGGTSITLKLALPK